MSMYYLKREVAELTRRHPCSVMRLVKEGILPEPVKLKPGGPCLFPKTEVDSALAVLASRRGAKAPA